MPGSCRAYAAKPPALAGLMPPPASNAEVSSALHRCLSPDPAARPTAAELRAVLSGRGAKPCHLRSGARSRRTSAPASAEERSSRWPPSRSCRTGSNCWAQTAVRCGSASAPNSARRLVRQFGPDGEFWDNRQCVLERNSGRQWVVSPVAGTTNETS